MTESDGAAVAAQLLKRTLADIDSVFGRLVYFAGIRDVQSGHYLNRVFDTLLPLEQADALLHREHMKVFLDWLRLNLVQQEGELARFAGGRRESDLALLKSFREHDVFCRLIPPAAAAHERALFMDDLLLLVRLVLDEDAPADKAPLRGMSVPLSVFQTDSYPKFI
jgi:hypothetical protein